MPQLTDSVGEQGANRKHDVALVQAMIRVIKNPKGQPYVSFNYDGVFTSGRDTSKGIKAFQADHPAPKVGPPPEPAGKINKDGWTFKKMVELLPADYKDIMALDITGVKDAPAAACLVYLAASLGDKAVAEGEVRNNAGFTDAFKTALIDLIGKMYEKHKIVFVVEPQSGGVRTFAKQRELMDKTFVNKKGETKHVTQSGPGESNHNFGNAADLGVSKNFRWIKGNGTIVRENNEWLAYYLSPGEVITPEAQAIWEVRNAVAKPLGLHKTSLKDDWIHIQTFQDSEISMGKSLARLMSEHGAMYWGYDGVYKCNYGLGDDTERFSVGSAKNIWDQKVNVSETNLAKALNQAIKRRNAAPGGKLPDWEEPIFQKIMSLRPKPPAEFKAADITVADCSVIRSFMKGDFERAEAEYKQWVPVDKSGNVIAD